jgi:phenylalanyl-tRNA synthetase beta chain
MTHLRPDLLPGLLRAAARNQARGQGDLALFEVGPTFTGGEPGEEAAMATAILTGNAGPRDPHGSRRPVDIYDIKADAEALLAALGAPARMQIARKAPGWFHPGRSGAFTLGPTTVAVFGEVHPRVLQALDVKGPVVALTLPLAALPQPKARSTARPALARADLQPVDRDFAFVVDARTEAATLVNAALGADKALIESVRVFDEFAGPRAEAQLGAGKKSLAFTVRLQPRDRTLTEAEIEAVAAKVIEKVAKATGGTLRG